MAAIAAIAIPAGINFGSSLLSSRGANKAGRTLQDAGRAAAGGVSQAAQNAQDAINRAVPQANDVLGNVFQGETNNLNPYLNLGTQSASTLGDMTKTPGQGLLSQFSFDPSQIANTPEYQFMLQQGTEAVQNSAAARGGLFGGNTLRGLDQYSQGLASTSYQQAYNNALNTFQTNRNNTLGALLAGTGVGQTATGQYNAAAQNYGNLVSSNTIAGQEYAGNVGLQGAEQAGNFWLQGAGGQAGAQVANGNIWGQAVSSLGSLIPQIPGLGGGPSLGPGGNIGNLPAGAGPNDPTIGTYSPILSASPAAPQSNATSGYAPLFSQAAPGNPTNTGVYQSASSLPPAPADLYAKTLAALRGTPMPSNIPQFMPGF